ncbi:MAG TPA: SDR family NAD(P)-dependent oxidoreductase [Ktedonobacteraceae bacterium]|jgi:acyl transferase domain-containing protein
MQDHDLEYPQTPIAIVGIGCRFPGDVSGPQSFWNFLMAGTDAVGEEIAARRWDMHRYYHPDPTRPGKLYCPRAAFLSAVDQFDAAFFGVPPGEAARMDPQQRILLEVCWEALEDGGLIPQQLAGSPTGVFIGISSNDYGMLQIQDVNSVNAYTNAGQTCSIASNRISYLFDFHGPSFSVDTACSSSMVALHLACESLAKGECSLALAGGVSIVLEPALSVGLSKAYMLSPHGQCRAFDAEANGYVRGEGAGVVVLKPLAQAQADGDEIYAVLLATGINQDGRTPGLHQPSRAAQEALLRQVYAQAGVAPTEVSYVEAHGTGTTVGDFIEGNALGTVLGKQRAEGQWLHVGSVKTQIGHLEAASGIAGLIKTALILKHRQVPANLHFHTPNPQIPFEELHLKVQAQPGPLPGEAALPIAGVNNFGFGGTNAHAVLQAAPQQSVAQPQTPQTDQQPQVLALSARHPQALAALAQSYLQMLSTPEQPPLSDLCFSAAMRREHHTQRLGIVAQSAADLSEKLQAFLNAQPHAGVAAGSVPVGATPGVTFVFAGNGPQWWGMARQLLNEHTLFRATLEQCDRLLTPYTGWSLLSELLAGEAHSRMDHTDVAQTALFAIQVALAAVWKSWGIEPEAVIGHSVGEIAAAYVAGILTLEDAIKVVYHRSRLQELTAGMGKMAAVGISAQEAQQLLTRYQGRVSLAGVNSPSSVTLSGEAAAVQEIVSALDERDVFARVLQLNYAFHCPYLDPIREELCASLADIRPQPARIRFVSTVSGRDLHGEECDASYWWENIRLPVQFAAGVEQLLAEDGRIFLEIGPHPVLAHYLAECMEYTERTGVVLPSLRRKENDLLTLLGSLASLYARGCPVRWHALVGAGRRVSLPLYPWQHERYWNAPRASSQLPRGTISHPLLGSALKTTPPIWENVMDQQDGSIIAEHCIDNAAVVSLAGFAEIILIAARELLGKDSYILEDMKVHQPLALSDGSALSVQTLLSREDHTFQISSRGQEEQASWLLHASGQVRALESMSAPGGLDLEEIRRRCTSVLDAQEFYRRAIPGNVSYSERFKCVERVYLGEREALAEIHWPQIADEQDAHLVFLDNCVQALFSLFPSNHIPVTVEHLIAYRRREATRFYCSARLVKQYANAYHLDAMVIDEDGRPVVEIYNLRVQAASFLRAQESETPEDCLYEDRWVLEPRRQSRVAPLQLPAVRALLGARATSWQVAGTYELAPVELLCQTYILNALRDLGWNPQAGESFDLPSLRQHLEIAVRYEAVLGAWCRFLTQQGLLTSGADGWTVGQLPARSEADDLLPELLRAYPGAHADFILLARCGRHLPAILSGKVEPPALLFSEEALMYTEHFFESGVAYREANSSLQAVVAQIVKHLPPTRQLRILEIGAGTGGTTAWLLSALCTLPADQVVYVFSDSSQAALTRAQQKYQQYPFMRYQQLDSQRGLDQQEFGAHGYDLIVATRAFVGASDRLSVLRQIRQLLAEQGLLAVLAEADPLSPAPLLITGLLATSPLPVLSSSAWVQTLQAAGLSEAAGIESKKPRSDVSLFLAREPRATHPETTQAPAARKALPGRKWVLFADSHGLAGRLAENIEAQGEVALLVEKGQTYQRLAERRFMIRPGSLEDTRQLLDTLQAEELLGEQIVYLWGNERLDSEQTSAQALRSLVVTASWGVVALVQSLVKSEWHPLPRLWIVTTGAQAPESTQMRTIEQAPLYGLSRVIHHEHPELGCTLIDIGTTPDLEMLNALYEEMQAQESESELLLRPGARYVNRVRRIDASISLPASEVLAGSELAFRLQTATSGGLSRLVFQTMPRLRPGTGEVEIAVEAAGINFKDRINASGMTSSELGEEGYADEFSLGQECAGRITALGEGVSDLQIGDEVIALGRHCLGSHVLTEASFVARKPASISLKEGATIPLVFTTAYYALHHLARIRTGERVLIHGASGGIDLAAIQIVQQAHGEVFATAPSEEKRAYLRSLGVQHVLDSRSLSFADEILQITHGEGVDIVLNTMAGEAAAKSLALLRPFGRFLQLGKHDLLANKKVGLRPFNRGLSYFAIDMNRLWRDDPTLIAQILHELEDLFERGLYRPLPYRLYQLSQVREAFETIQQPQQIGKLVMSFARPSTLVSHTPPTTSLPFRSAALYLLIGGVSGFGLATAKWLVRRGARHLVLAGISGVATQEASEGIDLLKAYGASVSVVKVDVTQENEVAALLEKLRANPLPLRGVIHAAANFDDRAILELDEATIGKVMSPKVLGAWNLHRQLGEMPLDFFILYSSVTVMVGNNSQGSYVAGNAFMDALATTRRARGLTATAVEWGALAKVGVVAQNKELSEILTRKGLYALTAEQSLNLLEQVLDSGRPMLAIANVDWKRLDAFLLTSSSRARCLELLAAEKQETREQPEDLKSALLSCAPEERPARIQAYLVEALARLLGIPAATLAEQAAGTLSLDSLMAMELRHVLRRDLELDIPVMQILRAPGVTAMATMLSELLMERV